MSNSDGRLLKMEKDYSSTCDSELPAAESLCSSGNLPAAIDKLMALEKLTRNAGDLASNTRVQIAILTLCFRASDWTCLNDCIVALTKKHGALKAAMQKMIEEAVSYVPRVPAGETKVNLIKTLRVVTEGKIYVEVERARLTRLLSKMKEEEGNVNEAADILQELQVETYGSMEKREKTDFLLEQMRLCLARKDYTRTLIISRKVSKKYLNSETEAQDLKLRFYELMIIHAVEEGQYLEACKCYRHIFNTPVVSADSKKWQEALTYAVLFAVLAAYDKEQAAIVASLMHNEKIEKMPALRDFLKLFVTREIINWKETEEAHAAELKKSHVFNSETDQGKAHWNEFRKRVSEHNLRVIAHYYSNITFERLTQLLDLPSNDIEEYMSDLVTNKTIYARINRPAQLVSFSKAQDPEEIMNSWANNIHELLRVLERTSHLITKEEMIHKLKLSPDAEFDAQGEEDAETDAENAAAVDADDPMDANPGLEVTG